MNYKILGNVGLCIILFCAVALFAQKILDAPDVETLLKPPVKPAAEVQHLGEDILIKDYSVTFGQIGHKVDAAFTIQNRSELDVKNITVYCTMHDDDGKQWSHGRWKIFTTLPAQNDDVFTFTDKRFISHKAVSHKSVCQVIDLEIIGQDIPAVSEHGAQHGDHEMSDH